jgi:sulfide:quinone oxidoreductase
VLAAGDVTDFPLKQGGLATQQADAAAEAILAELGALDDPAPFRPVLRGVLFTDREPVELRGPTASADAAALWWPPGKIAGRRLWPYLIDHAAAPSGPPPRPWAEEVPVDVHLARVVAGERSALGADALPPG